MPIRAGAAGGDGGGDVGGGTGGGGAGAGAGADAFASESSVIVTGPSLTKCTCMSAPN